MFSPETFIFYYLCRINILSPIFLLNSYVFFLNTELIIRKTTTLFFIENIEFIKYEGKK